MESDAERSLDTAAAALAGAQVELMRAVAELDQSESWRSHGYGSMDQWLIARFGFGKATAVSYVKTARRLAEEPEIEHMLSTGEIGFDQARALCRLSATNADRSPATLSEKSADQIMRLARRQEKLDVDDAVRAHRWRYLRWDWSRDRHVLHLRGELPHDQGAVVLKAIDRLIRAMPPNAEDGLYDAYEAYAADALHQLASMRLGVDRDPDRSTVVVHVDAAELVDVASDAPGILEAGPAVTVETVRRLACDARIEWIIEDGDGSTIGIGRASRRIPGWLKRLVIRRDHGCRFPGCDRTRWVHLHHLVHWAQGGATDLDNLITLCNYHHRLVHEYRWGISGGPGGEVVFVRPNGVPFAYRDPTIVGSLERTRRREVGRGPWIPDPRGDP